MSQDRRPQGSLYDLIENMPKWSHISGWWYILIAIDGLGLRHKKYLWRALGRSPDRLIWYGPYLDMLSSRLLINVWCSFISAEVYMFVLVMIQGSMSTVHLLIESGFERFYPKCSTICYCYRRVSFLCSMSTNLDTIKLYKDAKTCCIWCIVPWICGTSVNRVSFHSAPSIFSMEFFGSVKRWYR